MNREKDQARYAEDRLSKAFLAFHNIECTEKHMDTIEVFACSKHELLDCLESHAKTLTADTDNIFARSEVKCCALAISATKKELGVPDTNGHAPAAAQAFEEVPFY